MTGSLLQLMAVGSENEYLNINPQMNFFKMVFKRHTNFSMEYVRLNLNGSNQLNFDNNIKLTCKIDRNGDLVYNSFFVFNLPDIYSGYDPETNTPYKFNWIEEIGNFIIHHTSIIIGGTTIDKQYGEWISIWSQLNIDNDKRKSYDKLIGNITELTDPENLPGNNGFYPTSTLDEKLTSDPQLSSISYIDILNPYEKSCSIKGRTIYVPLSFWFCNNSGLALPLISLQYHDIIFEIELKPLNSLFTIIETDINEPLYGQRVKPSSVKDNQTINNFLFNGNNISNTNLNSSKISSWNFDPHILVNYIFLDNDDRKMFAKKSHEYLITQVKKVDHLGIIGNKVIELNINHPVKQIIWTCQRNDLTQQNIFNNYINWENKNINPFTISWQKYVLSKYGNFNLSLEQIKKKIPNKSTAKFFNKETIKNCSIFFEGKPRVKEFDNIFYNFLQPYTTNNCQPNDGIYNYSFEIDNNKFQPSGSCNMSRIKKVTLNIETSDVDTYENFQNDLNYIYKYNLTVYSLNFNILRIMGGMGGLSFAN